MDRDMYITLPSNTQDYTGKNKTHSFRVQLPHPINLQGKWEVALVDIQFPYTWKNLVGAHTMQILYTEPPTPALRKVLKNIPLLLRGNIPEGHYSNIDSLMGAVRQGIRAAMREKPWVKACAQLNAYRLYLILKYRDIDYLQNKIGKQYTTGEFWRNPIALAGMRYSSTPGEVAKEAEYSSEYESKKAAYDPAGLTSPESDEEKELSYSFVNATNQLKVELEGKTIKAVILPEKLQYMLGLKTSILKKGIAVAKYSPDFTAGLTTLFVHCDIVEPQIIGNCRSELLRTIPVSSKHQFGDTVHKLFTSPHYVNVLHKNFDNICIDIRSDEGVPVPFDYGKVVVKLHFRKSKGL